MATISQRNTGSVWDKRARYIEQSTSALQRYIEIGDTVAMHTKMKEYIPDQAREADLSLYNRLLSDEQNTRPGRMPERSSGPALTSESTVWGRRYLAISGVSHQPLVQTAHHASAIGPGGSGVQDNGGGVHMRASNTGEVYQTLQQQDTAGPSTSTQTGFQQFYDNFKTLTIDDPYKSKKQKGVQKPSRLSMRVAAKKKNEAKCLCLVRFLRLLFMRLTTRQTKQQQCLDARRVIVWGGSGPNPVRAKLRAEKF
jgi:hypothetical protein